EKNLWSDSETFEKLKDFLQKVQSMTSISPPQAEGLLGDLEDEVKRSIQANYGNEDSSVTTFWNTTMDELKCCGFRNYTDFDDSPFNNRAELYPPQCCNSTITEGGCDLRAAQSSDIDGCFDKLVKLIEDNALVIAAVAIGIAALEVQCQTTWFFVFSQP
uniref:Tetraspanin n=1 Tax=Acanthochromis polyacanthus TaxID=80966 RepID=A0A3Q1H2E1_9TELE